MAHQPVATLAELEALDPDALVKGYLAGFYNQADYTQRDRAYWHGFLNGQVDKGYIKSSPEQHQLASLYVDGLRAQRVAKGAV